MIGLIDVDAEAEDERELGVEEEENEGFLGVEAYAVVDPGTVMVHVGHAVSARLAVVGLRRPHRVALVAVLRENLVHVGIPSLRQHHSHLVLKRRVLRQQLRELAGVVFSHRVQHSHHLLYIAT